MDVVNFIRTMPKAELHLHISGTMSPQTVMRLAERNGIDIPYKTEEDFVEAQQYKSPEDFFRYHMTCFEVLRTRQDIYDSTMDFLERCQEENIRHVELTFAPQQYFDNGISVDDLMEALDEASRDGLAKYGVSSVLLMCINREFSEESALDMLSAMIPHRDRIAGMGLCSNEKGNPPIKFRKAYDEARRQGYRLTAHCDCDMENSAQHIYQCIHVLGVERIDHGVNSIEDDSIVDALIDRKIPLTICPTWTPLDSRPRRIGRLRALHERGVTVTVNTDDPAEFASGYMCNMMEALTKHGFTPEELLNFMRNAFSSSWIAEAEKDKFLDELETHAKAHGLA
ncbi:adenosine deaminase [Hoeflea sp. CAU 1731]